MREVDILSDARRKAPIELCQRIIPLASVALWHFVIGDVFVPIAAPARLRDDVLYRTPSICALGPGQIAQIAYALALYR